MPNTYKIKILSYIKDMGNSLAFINNSKNKKENIKYFNYFIDLFVSLNNTMNLHLDDSMIISNKSEDFSNLLVKTVDSYNEDKQSMFYSLLDVVRSEFDKWSKLIKNHLKYKIIVFGINQLTLLVDKIVDSDKADIICYVDDSGEYAGKYLNDINIVKLSTIVNETFDYMLSVSTNESVVNKLKKSKFLVDDRFIDYLFYKKLIVSSPEFFIKHSEFLSSDKNFSGLLTGLSYVQKGVDEKLLKGNFFNLAYPAQDLFYDFEMFKYAYSFKEIKEQIKYVIIGLSYYSFHYDLSKSVNEARVNYYYPITKTMHNNKLIDNYIIHHQKLEEFESKVLSENHFFQAFEIEKDHFYNIITDGHMKQYDCKERTNEEILQDIASIKRDYNKNYPLTVSENKKILKDYLKFLKLHSIKPIIVVCPVTKLYQSFTPVFFQKELYEIINELSRHYQFQFLDYYHSSYFDDSDFYDPSHMNVKGSKKFAELLNHDINW